MVKMRMESEDIQQENVKKIAAMFPNCVTEARDEDGHLKKAINFELLKQMLSDSVIDGDEAYEFTWVGKKASIVEANRPIRKTLRPVKEDSVNWDTTENLYIEGDNLEVLKLLQESYLGKVKMIYIDPPYNTGNDFIYNDDFKVSSEEYADGSGEVDEEGNRMFKNTNSNGRFHSDWCSMIYSRLMLSRNLLTEDGAIFISIGDDEEANLIKLCDEIFGEQNFIASICHKARASVSNDRIISENHNHLVFYAKNIDVLYAHHKEIGEDPELRGFDKVDERGRYKLTPVDGPGGARKGNPYYEFLGVTGYWRYSKETMQQKYNQGLIVSTGNNLQQKYYIDQAEKSRKTVTTWWDEDFLTSSATADFIKLMGGKYFDNPKNVNLLLRCLKMITKFDKDAIVLDFFSGSATTAHAVMQFNAEDGGERKFIMVQLPEETDEKSEAFKAGYKNICEIGKERIRRAAKKIHEDNPDATFDDGFRVLKLDDTNMKDVYYAAGAYTQGMLSSMESNVKSDRTDLDLLFGCLIDWGLPLSLPYNSETIDGCRVHTYNDGDLIACFDENVPESVFKTIAKRQPLRAVFRDSSFTSSPEKINAGETFKLLAPDTRVKVI
ncbi:DNA methylase family protein [Bifidobacterium pseudolongum subsp. pseudolongum]|nr:DNA methylase family protein [Bifidobacterium pseudolongum subsp. pseudolongum]